MADNEAAGLAHEVALARHVCAEAARVFDRSRAIFSPSLGHPSASDLSRALDGLVVEMNRAIACAKKSIATMIAHEKRLGAELDAARASGLPTALALSDAWAEQKALVDELKHSLRIMSSSFERVKREKDLCVADALYQEAAAATRRAAASADEAALALDALERWAASAQAQDAREREHADSALAWQGRVEGALAAGFDELAAEASAQQREHEALALRWSTLRGKWCARRDTLAAEIARLGDRVDAATLAKMKQALR